MKNVVWTKGTSGLEGEFQSASEVDFYIDKVRYKLSTCKLSFITVFAHMFILAFFAKLVFSL